ncbi:FERM, ARHGEF and pleckstrin domain-containing protein 1-like isoform X2 [Eriocheir sinensis]|uniref:FERM, ARHGEF and pleckstrin domain-containing protein 1-like isoform X2 n=1 Tax=Eriocheir sinensis TaxID=95602 RepID=UPI0021C74424|nr:FERM, ARHGEF and pleckstrin domain-containing protein 1-like isoform X2 [Eriocheir sinensis]
MAGADGGGVGGGGRSLGGGGGPGDGGGVRTPPTTPKKVGGKMLAVKILMLDDTYTLFQIQSKACASVLLEQVCRQLNLLESDYFGLEYTDGNTRYWLDLEKPMSRQVCLSQVEPVLRFCVKFYTPDPAQLEEEYTRYLFALQIKRDLAHGCLLCNDNTAALMASYIVQAECGDFVEEDYPDHRYLSLYKFVPSQDPELERKIMENHKKHVGMTPAAADLNLLETARRCELYGIKMHPAKDNEGVPLNLAVAHMGVLVFQNYTKINTFSWAKIRKLSFKRKRFLTKLHPEGYDIVEFFFDGRNECKNFWKKCVEHHGFFRCSQVKKVPRHKTRVLSRGSSFRYSGRTQKQVQEFVRDNYVKRAPFQRSQSFRHSPSVHASVSSVGMSISAQPLLPLSDNQCIGTPVSLSCGSMTLASTGDPQSPGSPTQTETADLHDFDTRDLETPSVTPSRQDTLSPETSVTSSPQRGHDPEYPHHPAPSSISVQASAPPLEAASSRVCEAAAAAAAPHPPSSPSAPAPQDQPVAGSPSPTTTPLSAHKENIPISNHVNNRVDSLPNGHDKTVSPARVGEMEGESRKRKYPSDKAYFIAKEILTTERTYKKDLEVINLWLREEVGKEEGMPGETLSKLFQLIDPIYEFHTQFLKELDTRLAQWDGRASGSNKMESQRIGDIMLKNMSMIKLYENYLEGHYAILEGLESSFRKNRRFEQIYREFEMQKVCYLPMTSFILKPLHRLQHYHLLLDRLVKHYGSANHHDYRECMTAKAKLGQIIKSMTSRLTASENLVKLVELQRDLVGIDNLIQPGREFLREGCLQKLSRKGYQQRMFFLFNDVLLYTNRTTTPVLQFKVHGQLPLRGVMVEETESRMGASNCFTIYGGNRALMVAANGEEEKTKWLEDLTTAINQAKTRPDDAFHYLSLKSISSSDEVLDRSDGSALDDSLTAMRGLGEKGASPQQRSNTTVHVCWHRATSVSAHDYSLAVQNQLSGYLLRKFKNSMGWQKLWVVFTNFCLFFYKTFQDDFPLASLPLLGYVITTPGEDDQIQKEFVFKLQFKNHVYFFRAESEFTFSRWMEVISTATQNSSRSFASSHHENENESIRL